MTTTRKDSGFGISRLGLKILFGFWSSGNFALVADYKIEANKKGVATRQKDWLLTWNVCGVLALEVGTRELTNDGGGEERREIENDERDEAEEGVLRAIVRG